MGQVYLARSTGLGGFERQVVLKTLDPDPEASEDEQLIKMFLDEARLLGALHHQYIAPVYEVGRDERGRYFLVMDYVRGESAEAVYNAAKEAGGPATAAFALTVVSSVASALEYAHALRAPDGTQLEIVHRDVSLSNIMIGHDGAVKLIDFGIAKFAKRTTHTQIGSLKGKLAYLSPEQITSKPVDRRADIFALGIVLYELATLSRAFEADSELLTLEKITKGDLALPSQLVPDFPRELERIIMKALALDPDLRYQDAGAMGRDLVTYAAREGILVGHGAIVAEMKRLFDAAPGGRRRFARASSEVDTGKHAKQDSDPNDMTPVEPIELDDTTGRKPAEVEDQPTIPLEVIVPAVETVTITVPPEELVPPQASMAFAGPSPAPLVIRISTPHPIPPPFPAPQARAPSPAPLARPPRASSPVLVQPQPVTVTAQLPRHHRPVGPHWWWPLVLFAAVVVVATLVALL